MTEERHYRKRLYASYDKGMTELGVPLERVVWQHGRRWGFALPLDRAAPILDIGCGTGEFLLFLHRAGHTSLHGVDYVPTSVEAARRHGIQGVEAGDALEYLRKRPGEFAVVSAQNVLEHQTRDELLELLDAIHDALRPGGALWATVPNALSPFGMAVRYSDLTHETAFAPRGMRQVLAACGFDRAAFREVRPLVHGPASALRAAGWQAIRAGLHAWRLIEYGAAPDPVYTHDMQFVAKRGA